ncbi:hypothetical protein QFZ83_006434 [Variovorax sp. W1I1]|uniref:hypothetical protein n=1 Tax=Variovorax sp. W1I1 TaxID=3042309 RepID=UPI002785C0C3|nr:hypothetical protein [Variovorax sp. W1I1]MDQ0612263.1 hypothetical protein [Variovorax sp. W1I1]
MFRIHLAADALMACEVHAQRGSRRVVRKVKLPFPAGERTAAMQSLREWMAAGTQTETVALSALRRTSQEWVLGIADVRYLLLPWTPDLADKALRSAFANALFEQQFKQDPNLYDVRFAKAAYGGTQLAAFISHALLTELQSHADACKIRLSSVAPSLATVWDRFHAVIQKECGVVHMVDGDRQIVVRHAKGQMTDILFRPFDAGHQDDASSAHEPGGSSRVFPVRPLGYLSADTALALADGDGFLSTQDAAYAFALCGVF